jgi:hypothetical protein
MTGVALATYRFPDFDFFTASFANSHPITLMLFPKLPSLPELYSG